MDEKPLKIAIVGSGVAGLTAAFLLQRQHTVTLFEKNTYVGGHTNTVVVPSGPEKWTPLDMGFALFNDRTYPGFEKLLGQLGIGTRPCRLTFGYFDEKNGFRYALTTLNGLWAQRSNLWNPSFWWMLREAARFNRKAQKDLANGKLEGLTVGDYLNQGGFSRKFIQDYLLPLGSAVWMVSGRVMVEFPAILLIGFLKAQGMLRLGGWPPWKTVVEGSHQYVRMLLKKTVARVKVNDPVEEVRRTGEQVTVKTRSGKEETFDKVVLACHADEALGLLAEPSEDEQRLLSPWRYEKNFAVLHTDVDVMPPHARSWAAWNYFREKETTSSEPVSVTYHLNRIQGIETPTQYFVTFNRLRPIPEKHILKEIFYTHPIYTPETVRTQTELPNLNGVNNTYFCGSYFGFGSHEDAVQSAIAVGKCFGAGL